jgi:hypothetical protein
MISNRLQEFLQRLTAPTRNNLLSELERLELCGAEIPALRRSWKGYAPNFAQMDKLPNAALRPPAISSRRWNSLNEGAPEHANTGRIQRGSLSPIWEWISRDLLPTMARDYTKQMSELVAADKQREARQAAAAFQTKVIKSLENTVGSPDGAEQIRSRLSTYTASGAVYDDLVKILAALRAQDALAQFNEALPARLGKFEDDQVEKVTVLLDAFAKNHADQVPFALTLVARRLKSSWQLIRLATKAAPTKNAADIAATPFAVAVSMVLDRIEDCRAILRVALRNERILVAREILVTVYDAEYALRVRIDQLNGSEWGQRLERLMASIAALVESEVSRFPDNVGHILGSRSLRSHESLAGRMTYWAWKGRDALSDGFAFCKRMVGAPANSRV